MNGFRGVSKRKNREAYEAYVMVRNSGGRTKSSFKAHVGTYPTPDEAYKARIAFINGLK